MAMFRTWFKIFGETSLKQGLGRIRSFSEDRKPRQWLVEDQWAVRQPGSTCPDVCEKPKKPPKSSKSWISICRDPPPKELECDIRHNNCPPPPKDDPPPPWYSLDNFMSKKKPQEKLAPTQICREELKRREIYGEEEEVCENIVNKCFPENITPEPTECCMPKSEPSPAPVKTIACPLPKELDITLWCERPLTCPKIRTSCQSDKLPYEEFRPHKSWKPPPFSLPLRGERSAVLAPCCSGPTPFEEFKQVDLPKPLYTRYKSVELSNENLMLCMTDVKCAEDEHKNLAITQLPSPIKRPQKPPCEKREKIIEKLTCPEKPLLEAACCKPVRLRNAPKYTFKAKPTKLLENKVPKAFFVHHKTSDLMSSSQRINDEKADAKPKESKDAEDPKIIPSTLVEEPQTFKRDVTVPSGPPKWMYAICKPGAKKTPLVPFAEEPASEPDRNAEADGFKVIDKNDEDRKPQPPDPSVVANAEAEKAKEPVFATPKPEPGPKKIPEPVYEFKNRFVLMPEQYNIKPAIAQDWVDDSMSHFFENYLESQTDSMSISYPPMKENILYDLQRLCSYPPLDHSNLNPLSRKPEQQQPPKFFRSFSTLSPSAFENLCPPQVLKTQKRSECGDSSGKCKIRNIIPKRDCQEPPPKPDCAEITLPGCPKARVPPDCDVKKAMPICKRKLPPKPSFSECSKDPPPCPRITECDCWEKLGGKNRKYSIWAAQRGVTSSSFTFLGNRPVTLIQVSKGPPRSSDTRGRSKYTSKVKCFTLQPAQEVKDAIKNRVLLGLKDSNDSSCDYESRPIVAKKRTKKSVPDVKAGHLLANAIEARLPQSRTYFTKQEPCTSAKTSDVAVREQTFSKHAGTKTIDEERLSNEKFDDEKLDEDNSVTFYEAPERNEENSKAFMSSFGSWINELFNAPVKRSMSPEVEKCKVKKESVHEEDAEYLKSISAIKEQFRKKLKSETSVQVSSPDRPFAFNFDKVSDRSNKTKKKAKSLPEPSSVDWIEELNQFDEKSAEIGDNLSGRRYNPNPTATGLIIKPEEKVAAAKPTKKRKSVLNNSILLKETKKRKTRNRHNLSELEEYIFPTPKELSKRILLNVPNEDKCVQFYKNSHLGMQEAQHYGQRKTKAYQSGARCYTTNANLIDGSVDSSTSKALTSPNKPSNYCTSSATEIRSVDDVLRKNSLAYKKYAPRKPYKKTVSDLTRDSMSFVKLKTSKAVQPFSQEPLKVDLKTSSHDLVKYLIKKIKTTRPQAIKQNRGNSNVPQLLTTQKSRFMQSATNTLVLSAIAKKDNETAVKSNSRMLIEPKAFSGKELVLNQYDNNLRIDVSKALGPNKFSKLTYLLENDHIGDDTLSIEQENYKNTRRPYEDALKRDAKKMSKHNKRQEVKQELSNLDKCDILELPKPKKKLEENVEISMQETREAQNARFQKQHELFKTNLKQQPENLEPIPASIETKAITTQELSQDNCSLSTELAVIEPDLQFAPNSSKTEMVDHPKFFEPTSTESQVEVTEYLTVDEKPHISEVENTSLGRIAAKDKVPKAKPMQFPKDGDSKIILDSLEKFCAPEQPKGTPQLSADLGPVEDVLPLNRRYSPNSLVESSQKNRPSWNNNSSSSNSTSPRTTLRLDDTMKGAGRNEKQTSRKKKEKRSAKFSRGTINQTASEYPCGFEISKKKQAQPNCKKEE